MGIELGRRDVRALLGLTARRKAEIVVHKYLSLGLNLRLLQVNTRGAHGQEAPQNRRDSREILVDAREGELREHGQDDVPEHLISPTDPLFFEGTLVICGQMRGHGPAQTRKGITSRI